MEAKIADECWQVWEISVCVPLSLETLVTCPVGGMLRQALVSDKKRRLLMSVGQLGRDLVAFSIESRDRYGGTKRESVSARQLGERMDCGHQYGWFPVEEARR